MISVQDSSFLLRLFVDKERNQVIMAEASGDFVDTLFSFLTLPLGTIIRLTSNDQYPPKIGCINNLYQSVKDCDTKVFWNEICKKMLLCPRNPCEALCQKLKMNVDNTEPTKYWMCGFCVRNKRSGLLLSTFAGTSCSCGNVMTQETKLQEDDSSMGDAQMDGVFVKKDATYLLFDDLKVLENSVTNSVQQFLQLGYTYINRLTEMFLKVGSKEILDILKRALISKSPLTDVFINKKDGDSNSMWSFTPKVKNAHTSSCSIQLKIIVSKSMKKIMYAEAKEDFFDFLLSFLTIPLGSILRLLDDNISLGSMDTLYKSVKSMRSSWFARSLSSSGTPLLRLGVAPQYGCKKQPLQLHEEEISKVPSQYGLINMFDPRSHDGRTEHAVGFVRRPSFFVVTDNLRVTPVTSTSSILFLQKLNVPDLHDLEEHVVTIDNSRALNLLGASLTSEAALTKGLWNLLRRSHIMNLCSLRSLKFDRLV